MRLFFLILAFVPVAGLAAPRNEPPVAPGCAKNRPTIASDGSGARPKRLGELPPAALYLSVDRPVGTCRVPVVIRYGIGVPAQRPAPGGGD